MSSPYWLIPCAIGLALLFWLIKSELKDLMVFTTFSKPDLFRHLPYLYRHASQFLVENPSGYIERRPVKIVRTLETIADSQDLRLRYRAMQAIVDNIEAVAELDEGAAATALLTVINKSDHSSSTHHRALLIRPGIIDNLATTDPVKAVQLAQKGIVSEEAGERIYIQSCELALRHLNNAFAVEPIVAAHAACNIARKTQGETRENALWMLLSHMNMISAADFESGHAAAEQAVLLGALETPMHQAALGMWEWHIQHVLRNNPGVLIDKIFYGFGISTASAANKANLYEHGFDFLTRHPEIVKQHAEEIVKVSLCIGLRTNQNTPLYHKTVEMWTLALQDLCSQNLHVALQAANDAMTFTAPGSHFERQAQMAYCQLRRLEDEVQHGSQTMFSEGRKL